jgi:predicted nucleic acid-binding protein
LIVMRLLIDINVLLDVALARPGAPESARLLGACGRRHEGWLAWHSLATLAYLIERQQSSISGRDFIRSMLVWADVAKTGRADALAALELPMRDFEDALQAAAAMACGAQFIITRNERDFKTSPVPALSPDAFLRRYPESSPPAGA